MPTQNHIHLDTSVSATGEKAPPTTFKITKRKFGYRVYASADRGLTGQLIVQVLADETESPKVFKDMDYEIHVYSETELDTLMAMIGKVVYLVDIVHVNDGSDHTSNVRTMWFARASEPKELTPALGNYLVNIMLQDKDTVS